MADISAEIAAFQNAVYGEDVRSAMVSLANKVNNESSAAATTVSNINSEINPISISWHTGKFYDRYSKLVTTAATYEYTDVIDLRPYEGITFTVYLSNESACVLYNEDKVKVGVIRGSGSNVEAVMQSISSDDHPFIALSSYYSGSTKPSVVFGKLKTQSGDATALYVHDPTTSLIKGFYDNLIMSGNSIRQGLLVSASGQYATKPIDLVDSATYYTNGIHTKYFAFFDENMSWISGNSGQDGETTLTNPFTPPTGAKYGVFSSYNETQKNQAWIFTSNSVPPAFAYIAANRAYAIHVIKDVIEDVLTITPVDYSGKDICAFKRCLCIGDSLTQGGFNRDPSADTSGIPHDYSYPKVLQMLTGMEVTNAGIGGETTLGWWAHFRDGDITQITGKYDMAIIYLGVNDVAKNGSWSSSSATHLGQIIDKLETDYTGIKIFVCNFIPGTSYSSSPYETANTALTEYINSLNDANVMLLDMWDYSHIGSSKAYNYGHFTAYGYWLVATEISNYISYLMHQSPERFRFIQLIATPYTATDQSFL